MIRITDKIEIKNVCFANRLVMPPIGTKLSDMGKVNDKILKHYEDRARGNNPGLLITEHSSVSLGGKADKNMLSIAEDSDIDGLKKLTEIIHGAGDIKTISQLNHAGSVVAENVPGRQCWAPSAIVHPTFEVKETPHEMKKDEIKRIVECYAKAAGRAKAAGYDGVQIHSAHGYLLNLFLSPLTNKRTDKYGGDTIEERAEIHREVIRAVRSEVGNDYILSIRFGADYMDGGNTIEDCVKAAEIFVKEGVDLLDISGGICRYGIVDGKAPGFFSGMTGEIKKALDVPVILTGNIRNRGDAEKFLTEGSADFIGVARPILADKDWAKNNIW